MGKLGVETQQSAAHEPASLVHTAANNEETVSNKSEDKDQHPSVPYNLHTSTPLPLQCAPNTHMHTHVASIHTCIHICIDTDKSKVIRKALGGYRVELTDNLE